MIAFLKYIVVSFMHILCCLFHYYSQTTLQNAILENVDAGNQPLSCRFLLFSPFMSAHAQRPAVQQHVRPCAHRVHHIPLIPAREIPDLTSADTPEIVSVGDGQPPVVGDRNV